MMKLKKILSSAMLVAGILTSVNGFMSTPVVEAAKTDIKDFPRVAVMNFGNKAITSKGLRGHDMAMATEYALYQLNASGWFDLIDYESLNAMANMHSINMSGLVDQGTAVQLGKVAGAEYMVVGNVTGLTVKENQAGIGGFNAKAGVGEHVVTANVMLRIVDIETGRVVAMGMGRDSSTSTMTEIGFTKYTNRKVEKEVLNNSSMNTVVNELSGQVSKYINGGSSYNNSSNKVNSSTTSSANQSVSESGNSSYSSSNVKDVISGYGTSYNNNVGGSASSNGYSSSTTTTNKPQNITSTTSQYAVYSIEGDINEDGRIDSVDYSILEYYIRNGYEKTKSNYKFNDNNADLNKDGKIDIKDCKELRALIAGLNHQTYKYTLGNLKNSDSDGKVLVEDLEFLIKHIVELPVEIDVLKADMNEDGVLDLKDLTKAIKIIEGMETPNLKREIGIPYNSIPQKFKDYQARPTTTNTTVTGGQNVDSKVDINKNDMSYSDYNNGGTSGFYDYNSIEAQQGNASTNYNRDANQNSSSDYKYSKDSSSNSGYANAESSASAQINKANNSTTTSDSTKYITYERDKMDFTITIGTKEVSEIQVVNAISKAIRDAVYGNTGLLTTLNNGKKLKIKTGF